MEKKVKIHELHDFENTPYKIKDDEDMEMLIESIKEHGIIEKPIVRPLDTGGYEILSGHRRKYACLKLGIEEINVDIREMNRDMAVITMVDSNFQRTNILPSEKAFAYKMKLEALKHQGKKIDLDYFSTSDRNGPKLTSRQIVDKLKTSEQIGKLMGQSGRTVERYIRLTYLEKSILDMVDKNLIGISPAVEISFLRENEQKDLIEAMDLEDRTPSYSQAIRMHKLSSEDKLDTKTIFEIMAEDKPNQREQLKLPIDSIQQYFPKNFTPQEMMDKIQDLLEKYQRNWQKEKHNRDAR